MNILGISCYYHDSAAALVRDGRIVAAAQEERFTRKKHDFNFPSQAIAYCLSEAGIQVKDLDFVTFYDKPFLKFERILETYLAYAPRGISSFLMAMPLWLREKLWTAHHIHDELEGFEGKLLFTEHHESHAASAFYPSPFESAAFLTMDGVGEWTTTSYGVGKGRTIEILAEQKFPHSLGLLYSAFTYFTGFKVNSAEYKVMGLAPYGEPKYVTAIYDHLIDLKEDGSFKMNMEYFNYCAGLTMTSRKFDRLFGGPPRKGESRLTQREMDLARSLQEVTEEIMLRQSRHVRKETGEKNLVLAGGVALNCVGNGRILREAGFENIWIQPAAGDAGGALGAALFTWYGYLGHERSVSGKGDAQRGSYLGPVYEDDEIEMFLKRTGAPFAKLTREELLETVAGLISEENVIGWFQGRMEFGPRALGARSIIGDARSKKMQSVMNLKIKFRESFRPFAPSVLRERVDAYFGMRPSEESPYMLLVAPVRGWQPAAPGAAASPTGLDRLKGVRSPLPAITHVDGSARVQTVDADTNPDFHRLISAFGDQAGVPVLVNTSFNVRGEPIVCSPTDAYRCFMDTAMDVLVLGACVLERAVQPAGHPLLAGRREFEPD